MRILQVCSARKLGGGERHVADLSNSLTERGHDVYVAVAPSSPLIAKLSNVAAQNVLQLRMRNAFDVPSALRLARFIREQKIDVVHAHLARDYPLVSLAVRRYAQLVITRHVMFPLNRWHRLTLSRVARVIAVSEAVARALRTQKICDARKIQVIHNGIDLKRFERVMSETERAGVREKIGFDGSGRRYLVGTVGSLLPLKGHEEFARAAWLVASARDDVDFVIIGGSETGEREYRARLERLVEQLKLQSRVRLMNWPEELAPFYHSLDLYVSASHTEAFGLSIVEAMAAGLAVVATATEGAQEIIKNKETGLLVPVKDVEKLAEAITALLENALQRNGLGARAREDAQRFSLERMVDSVEHVYTDAMSSR